MHRVKNLNFISTSTWTSLCFFTCYFLLVALHPLTGIEQVIYRWKAAVNTQLFCLDHFFHTRDGLKDFHLKFIQCSSWTSCCFHVELLWRIFICNFSPIRRCYTNDIPFCTNPPHNIFLTFSDRGLELIAIKKLDLAFLFIFLTHKNGWEIHSEPHSQEVLNLPVSSTWTSSNKFCILYLFIPFSHMKTHTMQHMNFWLFSLWTSVLF